MKEKKDNLSEKWINEREKYKTHLGNKRSSDKSKFIDIYSYKGCQKAKKNLKYDRYQKDRKFLIDRILCLIEDNTKGLALDLMDKLISKGNEITALENDYILGDIYDMYIKK